MPAPAYAELHCLSNFSFLRGASSAQELVERARALGYAALAITDECSFAGVVRAHEAAQKSKSRRPFKLIIGTELALDDGVRLVLLARNHAGYAALCRAITAGRRGAQKGSYKLTRAQLEQLGEGVLALLLPSATPADCEAAQWLARSFPGRAWIAVELHRGADDAGRLAMLLELAQSSGLRAVACGDVHMHVRARRALQDTMCSIRIATPVAEAGFALFPNGERHLRRREALARTYPPELLAESCRIAALCEFSLAELRYEYPHEVVPAGETPAGYLRRLTEAGARRRWPEGLPEKVRAQIEHELALIAELGYECYFLTVHDIVAFARERGILCQGRGSAANSAVCFCLGITEVDPDRGNLLFERFISRERNEPPDIDVDFEHERREEVIQHIYAKYGRERAALAATVITYQPRSAMRDVAKALGFSPDQLDGLSRAVAWWNREDSFDGRLEEQGFDPAAPVVRRLLYLVQELLGFPRHLSQHVGGFVICERPLSELVPVENATMPDRTVIQWDKDDLEALGLMKVDCLALGMLSAIRRCFDLVALHRGRRWTLATLPAEDPVTYAMIQAADTVGVFQIESRAQMAMLPRLKPANFYDLVIETAIVRPGPIQGRMVHPYLKRRQGKEPVSFPSEELRAVLGRTLGIPIFQEQVMHLAIVAAGFSPGEADQLRRSMAAWKRHGDIEHYQRRILEGMRARGYEAGFAEQIVEQIKGFGSYGFPESHAASFALLVYASCWLKRHEPAAFTCALLNSQPMGFYAPAQLIADLRAHGVQVRPAEVSHSDWDCTLEQLFPNPSPALPEHRGGRMLRERGADSSLALRLGLRMVRGLGEDAARRIAAARMMAPFADVADLVHRAGLNEFERTRLADAGALRSLAGHRHRARWAVQGAETPPGVLAASAIAEERVELRPPTRAADTFSDYAQLGFSLGAHPVALVRRQLRRRGARSARELERIPHGSATRVAGLVTVRQRPASASNVTFLTLEDETGLVNIVVWQQLAQEQRRELLESRLLAVDGTLEKVDGVQHLIARRLHNYNELIGRLDARSRDFH